MHPEDVMPYPDIVELFDIVRQLHAVGCWRKQGDVNKLGGRDAKGKIMCEMRRTYAENQDGAWQYVTDGLPEWPAGVMLIREAFNDYDFQEVATLIRLFTKLAELVLRTTQGVVRCFVGAPLY
jgi:hypothetical protein